MENACTVKECSTVPKELITWTYTYYDELTMYVAEDSFHAFTCHGHSAAVAEDAKKSRHLTHFKRTFLI